MITLGAGLYFFTQPRDHAAPQTSQALYFLTKIHTVIIVVDKKDREDMLGAWLDRVEEDAQLPECDTTIDME